MFEPGYYTFVVKALHNGKMEIRTMIDLTYQYQFMILSYEKLKEYKHQIKNIYTAANPDRTNIEVCERYVAPLPSPEE